MGCLREESKAGKARSWGDLGRNKWAKTEG